MHCARYQEWMIPAALGGLPPERLGELDAHLQTCAPCRAEIARLQILSTAIDRGVAATVSAQPSLQLAARVRAEISGMPAPSVWPFARWIPFAAGALAAIALASLFLRPRVPSGTPRATPELASNTAATLKVSPLPAADVPSPPHHTIAGGKRNHKGADQPTVLVPRGEWGATLRFAAAIARGRVNGTEMIAAAEKSRQPLIVPSLEIEPIVIAPLSDVSEAPPDGAGANNR